MHKEDIEDIVIYSIRGCKKTLYRNVFYRLKNQYPSLTTKQLDEMTKITMFHLVENAKTLANKRCR